MRRSTNGPRSASTAASLAIRQGSSVTRRATSTDENNMKSERGFIEDAQQGIAGAGSGPVTARLKMLEKKYSQVLEMQAKFQIMDKWIQQQFGIKLFPPAVVNSEKFATGNPDDEDNPFYAVYLVIQRMKFLEEKVKKLEARPFDEFPEAKPTSNYSSAHAFRNFKGKAGTVAGGVKRTYGSATPPTTPKKAKVMPRQAPQASNYPFKPSVKILPRDHKVASPVKKQVETSEAPPTKDITQPTKQSEEPPTKKDDKVEDKAILSPEKGKEVITEPQQAAPANSGDSENDIQQQIQETVASTSANVPPESVNATETQSQTESEDANMAVSTETENSTVEDTEEVNQIKQSDDNKETESVQTEAETVKEGENEELLSIPTTEIKVENDANEALVGHVEERSNEDDIPLLEENLAYEEDMDVDSEHDQEEDELEQKPLIPLEEETFGGDISGSEASVSSATSTSGRSRLSTRRQAAAAAAAAASSRKGTEDEKPVMYTARGRRHTVPRRYAEFTGHDNVVSILKSQQRAEKSGSTGGGKPGRKPGSSKMQQQDTPPKIKKMVKGSKPITPKKLQQQFDSDGDGEGISGPSKKKSASSSQPGERPACVDTLVARVMEREVDLDGMVVLSEAYPNIYVNQQQLVTVVVRSNGKATRLTRKMTTLVFEDSVLASASPFGTKYYKDRLPPEPLEAMVDFIADSGFEPHYTKKKIYMIVGQVCNEARAGRVSRKFMQPLEGTPPGPSGSSGQLQVQEPTISPPVSPSLSDSMS